MRCQSRLLGISRQLLPALSVAALLGLTVADAGGQFTVEKKEAEKKKIDKQRFEATTADGVKLVGDFYPPPPAKGKATNAPCVILLHEVGLQTSKASRRDFGRFPERLQEEGYAVLAFDFRGYGDSKEIDPNIYWRVHQYRRPTVGGGALRLPSKIEAREFRTGYEFGQLGNDLIAAKVWLNSKNNASECNSNNVCLIGAEQGAVLGLLWTLTEYKDPNRFKGANKSEGDDISSAVWLSMSNRLGSDLVDRQLQAAMLALRERMPTLVLYGRDDRASKAFWNRAFEWVKPRADADRFEDTNLKEVEKTSLTGTNLLNKDTLKTEDVILTWLKKAMPTRNWDQQRGGQAPTPFAIQHLGLPAGAGGFSRPY
jgi:pimeloyl-ACP methyl ester carboxylesterase